MYLRWMFIELKIVVGQLNSFAAMLSDTLNKFKQLTKHPERYLQTQNDVAEEIKNLLKGVYDYTKKQEQLDKNPSALPELIIKNFDDEQIWQELELQNSMKYSKFISEIPRIVACKNRLHFQSFNEESECTKESISGSEYENEEHENVHNGGGGGYSSNSAKKTPFDEEDISSESRQKGKERRKVQPSIVDDRFFKLSELEEFLEEEDKKENKKSKGKYKNDDDSDESVDFFEDVPSDNDDKMDEGGVRYDQFFDAPEEEISVYNRSKRKRKSSELNDEMGYDDNGLSVGDRRNEKQVRFDLSPASSTDSNGSDSEQEKVKKDKKNLKSSLDGRQERLQARIKALEEKAMSEKPWQLTGEVAAANRPVNSLLEEVLEFDRTTRPAPVVTQETTMKLEDIIRQRIKDKAWDDVERKVKPTMAPDEYKKELVLNQEKSKISLAEIYEQDYLKQKEALDPDAAEKPEEEPQEHRTIRAMTSALFAKLDALTNFHYTPKPVIPEVKIVSNLPAITMEEVAPVGTSDATLLAPEEVKAKGKGDLISKGERTKTDKKRERRKKKLRQRIKQKELEKQEKIVEKLRPGLGNKYSKQKAMETLKKLSNDKNVHQLEDKGKDKGIRSSSAFFNRLQEEVIGHIKGKTQETQKKEKPMFSAKKVKL